VVSFFRSYRFASPTKTVGDRRSVLVKRKF
jgi:hypothetical protein